MKNTGPNNLLLHLRSLDLDVTTGLHRWHRVPRRRTQAVTILRKQGYIEVRPKVDCFLVKVTDAGRAAE